MLVALEEELMLFVDLAEELPVSVVFEEELTVLSDLIDELVVPVDFMVEAPVELVGVVVEELTVTVD